MSSTTTTESTGQTPRKRQKQEPADSKVTAFASPNSDATTQARWTKNATTETSSFESRIMEEINVLKDQQNAIMERLDNFATAFEPATKHALFETAIYAFVGKKIPSHFDERFAEKLQHAVANICSSILDRLLNEGPKVPKHLSWQAPGKKERKKDASIPVYYKRPLVLAGLDGLLIYVQLVRDTSIQKWDPSARNLVCHNGYYLDALFASPVKQGRNGFTTAKQEVKAMRRKFTEAVAEQERGCQNAKDGIKAVAGALEKRGLTIYPSNMPFLIKELESMTQNTST